MKYYVLFIYEDVEPQLRGPYASRRLRDEAAKKLRATEGEDHGIYKLETTGRCSVEPYRGDFFDVDG